MYTLNEISIFVNAFTGINKRLTQSFNYRIVKRKINKYKENICRNLNNKQYTNNRVCMEWSDHLEQCHG